MDPKGKAPALAPPYRRDARKGYVPSDDLPHAGPEPSGYASRSFLSGKSLDGSRGAFSLEAEGVEYESDPPDSDDESTYDRGVGQWLHPLEDSVECWIVETSTKELGIPCQNPDCPQYHPDMGYSIPDPGRESGPPSSTGV